jgi:hypothetical protein
MISTWATLPWADDNGFLWLTQSRRLFLSMSPWFPDSININTKAMWLSMAWLMSWTQTFTCPSPSHAVPQCQDSPWKCALPLKYQKWPKHAIYTYSIRIMELLLYPSIRGVLTSVKVSYEYTWCIWQKLTHKRMKKIGSITKLVWLFLTTGLTDLTSCTHHTGLNGVGNWFDQLANLVSNNTLNKQNMLFQTFIYNPRL